MACKRARSSNETDSDPNVSPIQNPVKLLKITRSPEQEDQHQKLIAAMNYFSDKDYKRADTLLRQLDENVLAKPDQKIHALFKIFTRPENRFIDIVSIDKLLVKSPFSYSCLVTRILVDPRIPRIDSFYHKLTDLTIIDCMRIMYPDKGLLDVNQNLENTIEDERAVYRDCLLRTVARTSLDKSKEDEILESTKEVLRYLVSTPMGFISNASIWEGYSSSNTGYFQAVKDNYEKEQLRTPPPTSSKSCKTQPPGPATRTIFSRNLGTNLPASALPSVNRSFEERLQLMRQQQQQQRQRPDELEHQRVINNIHKVMGYTPKQIEAITAPIDIVKIPDEFKAKMRAQDKEYARVIRDSIPTSNIPNIDVKSIMEQPIPQEKLLDYGQVYKSDESFYKILTQITTRIKSVNDLEKLQDEVERIQKSKINGVVAFGLMIEATSKIVSGKFSQVDEILSAALNNIEQFSTSSTVLKMVLSNSVYLLKAVAYLARSNLVDCYQCIKMVLSKDPGNPDAHLLLVLMLLDHGYFEEAMNYMERSQFVNQTFHEDPTKDLFKLIKIHLKLALLPQTPSESDSDVDSEKKLACVQEFCDIASTFTKKQTVLHNLNFCMLVYKFTRITSFDESQKKKLRRILRCNCLTDSFPGSLVRMKNQFVKYTTEYAAANSKKPIISAASIMTDAQYPSLPPIKIIDTVSKRFMADETWNFLIRRFGHAFFMSDWMTFTRKYHENVLKTQLETDLDI